MIDTDDQGNVTITEVSIVKPIRGHDYGYYVEVQHEVGKGIFTVTYAMRFTKETTVQQMFEAILNQTKERNHG